jgi:DNA polymerase III subunit epsilon
MNWNECRIVAFDTETTGLEVFSGDRIIEFGCVEIQIKEDGTVASITPHNFLINPEMPIPRESTAVTGITDQMVANKPPFAELAQQIWDLLSNAIVVAHNLVFDVGFLKSEFARQNLVWPETKAEVDTLRLASLKIKDLRSKRLEKVANYLSIPLENAHRAVHDAEACGLVFVAMAQKYNAPKDLWELILWSEGTGNPPVNPHIEIKDQGGPEFISGPHLGKHIEEHPEYLQWMLIAKERKNGMWQPKFPHVLREWIVSWLKSKTTGRAESALKDDSAYDWNIDPTPWRVRPQSKEL